MEFKNKQELINFLQKEIIHFTKLQYFADEINEQYIENKQILENAYAELKQKKFNDDQERQIEADTDFRNQELAKKIRDFEQKNHCQLYYDDRSESDRPYDFNETKMIYFYNFCLREIEKIFNNFPIKFINSNAYDTTFYFEFLDENQKMQIIRLSNHNKKSNDQDEYYQDIIYKN